LLAYNDCNAYNAIMGQKGHGAASLTIRNIEAELKEGLRVRAARHGRSMEAELRDILRQALAEEGGRRLNLAEAIRRRVRPLGGIDLEPHPPVSINEPPSFDP
jgi:antitoxin FitA